MVGSATPPLLLLPESFCRLTLVVWTLLWPAVETEAETAESRRADVSEFDQERGDIEVCLTKGDAQLTFDLGHS